MLFSCVSLGKRKLVYMFLVQFFMLLSFSLPLGVGGRLWIVTVLLPGIFLYFGFVYFVSSRSNYCASKF